MKPTSNRSAIHYFIFGYCLILSERIWPWTGRLSLYYSNLHVFDFDPDEQEIDFSDYDIL